MFDFGTSLFCKFYVLFLKITKDRSIYFGDFGRNNSKIPAFWASLLYTFECGFTKKYKT